MAIDIGRRRFLVRLGGTTAMWVIPSSAQQSAHMRTVGFLMGLANDQESQTRVKAFERGLDKAGWAPGKDVRVEYRFAAGDANRMRTFAQELVRLQPDVIVGHSTPVVAELVQATRTIPIVFVVVADPVGSGFAASIARPGGNVTGFINLDATIPGKLLTMLSQIMPKLSRVALMLNPNTIAQAGQYSVYLNAFDAAAASLAVKAITAEVHSSAEIERSMAELGSEPGTGLIVMPDNFTTVHRDLIVALAAQRRIPAIYPYRYFVEAGGLMSYGVDVVDLFRRSAEYVSRILRGANPGDLPIQAPTKFEMVINVRAAKALGLIVPRILLAGADALID